MTIESAIVSGSGSTDDRVTSLEEKEFMKPGLATILRDQEKGKTEAEASLKELRSVEERRRQKSRDSSLWTALAAEQNSRAMEKAALEAQQSKNMAVAIRKVFDELAASPEDAF
jgi:hypothetical protein